MYFKSAFWQAFFAWKERGYRHFIRNIAENSNLSNNIKIYEELLTCNANIMRTYTFPSLPKHKFSFPLIVNAAKQIDNVFVYRDFSTDGTVKFLSQISQDVHIILVVFL